MTLAGWVVVWSAGISEMWASVSAVDGVLTGLRRKDMVDQELLFEALSVREVAVVKNGLGSRRRTHILAAETRGELATSMASTRWEIR